jgi:signal transduction histidine kinase
MRISTVYEPFGLVDLLHDLGQPLAGIRALASAPLSGADEPERPDELYERLRRIDELGAWMSDLLLSTAPATPASNEGSSADAARVVQEVVLAAAASFEGALRCQLPGTAPVRVEPLQLRRAVGNLVDNATRAAGSSGWVLARVRCARRRVCVEVEDNGPGFGRTPVHTGRGLEVTRAVMGRCGGAMEIAKGRRGGALVRLKLPPSAADNPV